MALEVMGPEILDFLETKQRNRDKVTFNDILQHLRQKFQIEKVAENQRSIQEFVMEWNANRIRQSREEKAAAAKAEAEAAVPEAAAEAKAQTQVAETGLRPEQIEALAELEAAARQREGNEVSTASSFKRERADTAPVEEANVANEEPEAKRPKSQLERLAAVIEKDPVKKSPAASSSGGAKKAQKNIMTQDFFMNNAPKQLVLVEQESGKQLPLEVKAFKTGSSGYFGNHRINLNVGGKDVTLIASMNFTVIGSKEWQKE